MFLVLKRMKSSPFWTTFLFLATEKFSVLDNILFFIS